MSNPAELVAAAPGARRRNMLVSHSAWLFAITLFGYPIVGNLIAMLQVESRVFSIPFRLALGFFSVWMIVITKRMQTDGWRKLMLVIWAVYIVRLVYDWGFQRLEGADYALEYFLASCALPAVGLMRGQAFRQRPFATVSFTLASVGVMTSMLATVLGNSSIQDVTTSSGRLSLVALDPVSLGYLASSALLCGLVLWRGSGMRAKLIMASLIAPLVWCLILTGSKGPALALILSGGCWAARNRKLWKFALLALPILALLLLLEGNPLSARLSGSEDDPSTLDRITILGDSINQIAGSPIIGSAFVELNSGFYPHNVFVEAGLAMGIPGALVFLVLMGFGFWGAWKTLNGDHALLGLLLIEGLFAGATSGAIWGASLIWIPLAMLPRSPAAGMRARAAARVAPAPAPVKIHAYNSRPGPAS